MAREEGRTTLTKVERQKAKTKDQKEKEHRKKKGHRKKEEHRRRQKPKEKKRKKKERLTATCRLLSLSQAFNKPPLKKRRKVQRKIQRKKSVTLKPISGMLAITQAGNSLAGKAQVQAGKVSTRYGTTTTPMTSTRMKMIGGRTTLAEEKMIKMVKAKRTFAGIM